MNRGLAVILCLCLLNLIKMYIWTAPLAPEESLSITPCQNINFDIKKKDWDYYSSMFNEGIDPIKSVQISLPLRLRGTIISDPVKSFAIIEDLNNKSQDLYRLGDIINGAKIVAMNRESVILDFDGAKQELTMSEASPRTSTVTGGGLTSSSGVDFTKIMTQLRLKPYFDGGKCVGFQIDNINNNFVKQMGLKDGDVIESINGVKVNDPLKALQMIYGLERSNPVHLGIERSDEKVELECRLKDEDI